MQAKIQYQFSAKVWQHNADGGWFFVSLPNKISAEIRQSLKWQEEGWGRMKASAAIKDFKWETAIWFDKKRNTYLLPLKAEVRQNTNCGLGDFIEVRIWV